METVHHTVLLPSLVLLFVSATVQPQSVCVARDSLRALLPTESPEQRAASFRAFRTFYLKAVRDTEPAFWEVMKPFRPDMEWFFMHSAGSDPLKELLLKRPDIRKAGAAWFACGFAVIEGEGDLYPAADPATLLAFADQLPRDLESYTRFRAAEDAQRVLDDAALQISWEQLRMRLERWEKFAREYPELPETQSEVEPHIRNLALLYLFGSDNTATYSEDHRIQPDLLASWRVFAAKNESSRYHQLIATLLANLSEDGGKMTLRDQTVFEKAGFGLEFGRWWPRFQGR